jgi:hypothetical protein
VTTIGSHIPEHIIDYTSTEVFQETGVSPKVELPKITVWKETIFTTGSESYMEVEFESDRAMIKLPLIVWNPAILRGALRLKNGFIIWSDIKSGKNVFRWPTE